MISTADSDIGGVLAAEGTDDAPTHDAGAVARGDPPAYAERAGSPDANAAAAGVGAGAQPPLPVPSYATSSPQKGSATATPAGSPAKLSPAKAPPGPGSTENDDGLDFLSADELRRQLRQANTKLRSWREVVRQLINQVLLSPAANERYKNEASEELSEILMQVEQITGVEYINCSFPAIESQMPTVDLVAWESLDNNQWSITWAPSWAITICCDGWMYLPFKLKIEIHEIRIAGILSLTFDAGLMNVEVGFAEKPQIDLRVDVDVTFGIVSMPFQSLVQEQIRKGLDEFLLNHLIEPRRTKFKVLAGKDSDKKGVTPEDFQRAQAAAAAAMKRTPIRQRAPSLAPQESSGGGDGGSEDRRHTAT